MLEVVKDVIKSKTMMGVMVLIIGISYISACDTRGLDNNSQFNTLNIQESN